MPPLGLSLLASIVDASRLSERLSLSSLPRSLHVSFFWLSVSLPTLPLHFLNISPSLFFFLCVFSSSCSPRSVYFKLAFLGLLACLTISVSCLLFSVSLSLPLYFDSSLAHLHLALMVPSLHPSLSHSLFFLTVSNFTFHFSHYSLSL